MSTDTPTAKRQRRKKPATKYIVTKDGVDCRLAPPRETGLGTDTTFKRGMLVPCVGNEEPAVFGGERSASNFIEKAIFTREELKNTMVDAHPRLQAILTPGVFTTRTFQQ